MNELLTIMEVLIIDKPVVMKSMNSGFKGFENALQNYAAENSGTIDIIITRNTKDYQKSRLAVMTPEVYNKMNAQE